MQPAAEVLFEAVEPGPSAHAFLAMSYHRLGDTDKARTAMEQLRTLMQEAPYASDSIAQGFLRQAETVLAEPAGKR